MIKNNDIISQCEYSLFIENLQEIWLEFRQNNYTISSGKQSERRKSTKIFFSQSLNLDDKKLSAVHQQGIALTL
jgi:hypothetical protein